MRVLKLSPEALTTYREGLDPLFFSPGHVKKPFTPGSFRKAVAREDFGPMLSEESSSNFISHILTKIEEKLLSLSKMLGSGIGTNNQEKIGLLLKQLNNLVDYLAEILASRSVSYKDRDVFINGLGRLELAPLLLCLSKIYKGCENSESILSALNEYAAVFSDESIGDKNDLCMKRIGALRNILSYTNILVPHISLKYDAANAGVFGFVSKAFSGMGSLFHANPVKNTLFNSGKILINTDSDIQEALKKYVRSLEQFISVTKSLQHMSEEEAHNVKIINFKLEVIKSLYQNLYKVNVIELISCLIEVRDLVVETFRDSKQNNSDKINKIDKRLAWCIQLIELALVSSEASSEKIAIIKVKIHEILHGNIVTDISVVATPKHLSSFFNGYDARNLLNMRNEEAVAKMFS